MDIENEELKEITNEIVTENNLKDLVFNIAQKLNELPLGEVTSISNLLNNEFDTKCDPLTQGKIFNYVGLIYRNFGINIDIEGTDFSGLAFKYPIKKDVLVGINYINGIINILIPTLNNFNIAPNKINLKLGESEFIVEVESSENKLYYIGISEFGKLLYAREGSVDGKDISVSNNLSGFNNQKEEINKNNEEIKSESYCYDFIPYKIIGPIRLDKTKEVNFEPNGVPLLYENELNHVVCRAIFIDSPANRENDNKELYLNYENNKVKITSYFDELLNELSKVCDDMIIEEADSDNFVRAYSKKLGIIIIAGKVDDNMLNHFVIFNGVESFNNSILNN